jgi:hypothetical protein
MKKPLTLALALVLCAAGLYAADLSIDFQVNTSDKDYAGNYLTFKGKPVSIERDQFALAPDGASGASKLESTAMFNVYRWDIFGGKLLPGGLRNFFLYAVADNAIRLGDCLAVTKVSDGTIQVRYVHRGTAFEFKTDSSGKLSLPGMVRSRVVGATDNTISTDFSASGKVADLDWAKVWSAAIADGKPVGTAGAKTGKIVDDIADSHVYVWGGVLQFTFDGKILKASGELSAKRP